MKLLLIQYFPLSNSNIMNKQLAIALSFVLFGSTSLFAQPMTKSGPKVLTKGSNFFQAPQWTPDGNSIVFTGEKFNGLWIISSTGKNMKQISNDEGVGYGYSWTDDCTYVVVRATRYENNRKLNGIKIINLKNNTENVIEDYSMDIKGLPQWKNGGSAIEIRKKDKQYQIKSGLASSSKLLSKRVTPGSIYETIVNYPTKCGDIIPALGEFKGRIVFNAKLSPDGSKIVFQVGGKGFFVCLSDGSGLKQIGNGENASWMPDSKFVIASLIKDDGHKITRGELFSVNTESGEYAPLYSNASIIASRPSVSPDGDQVVFNDPEKGIIYILDIQK